MMGLRDWIGLFVFVGVGWMGMFWGWDLGVVMRNGTLLKKFVMEDRWKRVVDGSNYD